MGELQSDAILVICDESDETTQSLKDRFANKENGQLMKEMSYFHPRLFDVVSIEESLSFPFLSKTLNINQENLFSELQDFANNFSNLKKLDDLTYFTAGMEIIDQPETNKETEDEDAESDDDGEIVKCVTNKKACNNCIQCCFRMISRIFQFVLSLRVYHDIAMYSSSM